MILVLVLSTSALLVLTWMWARAEDAYVRPGSAGVASVPAYPGRLDEDFGSGGIVTTTFGGEPARGMDLVVQPDGKLVVAGYAAEGGDQNIALVRYTVSGTLDTTFGTGGIVVTDLGGDDYGQAIALQPDGMFVVAGYTGQVGAFEVALVRYTLSGTLDTTFGSGGVVTAALGATQKGHDVALGGDSIVVVGDVGRGDDSDLLLLRYTLTGTLDATFGQGGVVTTSFSGDGDYGQSVVIQPDGRIVAGGYLFTCGCDDAFVARYTVSGTLDASFGQGGVVTTTVGNHDTKINVLALDGDRIVAAGTSYSGLDDDIAVFRYTVSGTLDASFGDGGVVTTNFGESSYDRAYAIDIRQDGKILVAGSNSEMYPALVRYCPDGTPDASFGTGGLVNADVGGNGEAYAVVTLLDHRVVVAGHSDGAYLALRYRPYFVYLPFVTKG